MSNVMPAYRSEDPTVEALKLADAIEAQGHQSVPAASPGKRMATNPSA